MKPTIKIEVLGQINGLDLKHGFDPTVTIKRNFFTFDLERLTLTSTKNNKMNKIKKNTI